MLSVRCLLQHGVGHAAGKCRWSGWLYREKSVRFDGTTLAFGPSLDSHRTKTLDRFADSKLRKEELI